MKACVRTRTVLRGWPPSHETKHKAEGAPGRAPTKRSLLCGEVIPRIWEPGTTVDTSRAYFAGFAPIFAGASYFAPGCCPALCLNTRMQPTMKAAITPDDA
jgi:hypothetical protein